MVQEIVVFNCARVGLLTATPSEVSYGGQVGRQARFARWTQGSHLHSMSLQESPCKLMKTGQD